MEKINLSDIPGLKNNNPEIYKEFKRYFKSDIKEAKKYFEIMVLKYGVRNYKLSDFLSYCASWTITIFDNDINPDCKRYLLKNVEFSSFKKLFIKDVLEDEFFSLVYSLLKKLKEEDPLIPSDKLEGIKYSNFEVVNDLQDYIKSIVIT